MQILKMTRMAACLVVAVSLAACSAGGGDGSGGSSGGASGGSSGGAGGGGSGSGLINTTQSAVNQATQGTPLTSVRDLVNALVDPNAGGLAALTGPLNDVTSDGAALAQLDDIVSTLAGYNDSALTPLIETLNGIIASALGGGGSGLSPAQLCALPGIGPQLASAAGSQCSGGGTGNPIDAAQLCALPLIGSQLASAGGATCSGGGAAPNTGLITTVQSTVGQLAGGTPLQPVQDLVNTLVDPNSGNLAQLTSQLEAVTSNGEALAQLNQLVASLAGYNDSALTPLVDTLNGILSGGGSGGSAPSAGTLLGQLPENPLTGALCGLLGCG